MKNTMMVLKGSGFNADTIEIVVENEGGKVFEKKYYYGYEVSYHPAFVSKDKPLDTELIKEKAEEYGVAIEDVKYGEGRNLFKESMGGKKR